MTRTERMKAAIAQGRTPKPADPVPAPEPAPVEAEPRPVSRKAAKKEAPATDAPTSVKRACGHRQGIADLEKTPCLGCLNRARTEKRKAKAGSRPPAATKGGTPFDRDRREAAFRYPPGTVMEARWTGTAWLVVVKFPAGDTLRELVTQATGVHAAMTQAWELYRQDAGPRPAEPQESC